MFWKFFDRRKKSRRESDVMMRMEDAVRKKHEAAKEAIQRLNQWRDDRRFHSLPVPFERREALNEQ